MPHLLTLVSAVLYVASFTPWNATFLIWVALVPWLIALEQRLRGPRAFQDAAREGLWLSILISLLGFYWVASVLINFSGLPSIFGVIGLLLYSLIGQPQLPLFALVLALARRHPFSPRLKRFELVFYALAYTAIDTLLPKLWVDTLGHSTYHQPRMRQAADLGGPALLTFAMAWVNFAAARAAATWIARGEPSVRPALKKCGRLLTAPAALVLALYVYGVWRYEDIRNYTQQAKRVFRAGYVQANIGDFEKIAAERGIRGAAEQVLSTFFRLSDELLAQEPKPDVVIWPETSFPSTFRTPLSPDELARDQKLESYVRSRGVPVLFGGYDHANGKDHNAFFYLTPKSDPRMGDLQVYRKNILLLFGEYIPGAETFPWIKQTFPQVGNFGRGPGPQVFTLDLPRLGPVRTGPLICYEILFPYFVIEAARAGSQLIVNITNDSWFGYYGEPDLHLALSVFRGIETRLPQVRSTNTGISALITADGSIVGATPKFEAKTGVWEVPLPDTPRWTLMKAWGDWFPKFALTAALLIWIIHENTGRNARRAGRKRR